MCKSAKSQEVFDRGGKIKYDGTRGVPVFQLPDLQWVSDFLLGYFYLDYNIFSWGDKIKYQQYERNIHFIYISYWKYSF